MTKSDGPTELEFFNIIATNFTDLKTRLVRGSKNYFKARFQIKKSNYLDLLFIQFFGVYYQAE